MKDCFKFAANRLVITNVDIQSVEPVDQRTRDSLQKSVQLAIEITTNSQEASARSVLNIRENSTEINRLEIIACIVCGTCFVKRGKRMERAALFSMR